MGVSAKDDASIEGVVQLPPPTVMRALNQRYGTNVEGPLTPGNPPAAVVYLDGNFSGPAKPRSDAVAQMGEKNMLFGQVMLVLREGGEVEFTNIEYINISVLF